MELTVVSVRNGRYPLEAAGQPGYLVMQEASSPESKAFLHRLCLRLSRRYFSQRILVTKAAEG